MTSALRSILALMFALFIAGCEDVGVSPGGGGGVGGMTYSGPCNIWETAFRTYVVWWEVPDEGDTVIVMEQPLFCSDTLNPDQDVLQMHVRYQQDTAAMDFVWLFADTLAIQWTTPPRIPVRLRRLSVPLGNTIPGPWVERNKAQCDLAPLRLSGYDHVIAEMGGYDVHYYY